MPSTSQQQKQIGAKVQGNRAAEFLAKAKEVHGNRYDYSKVVYVNNRTKVDIICPEHGEFEQAPSSHTTKGIGCSACSWDKRRAETGFLDITHPWLIAEWHPSLNGNLQPNQLTHGSNTRCWWKCPDCESAYDASVNVRTTLGSKCPFCSGKRVNDTNSLASLYPHIAKEWHPSRNGRRRPDEFTSSSSFLAWWLCALCESSFEATIHSRVRDNHRCPSCKAQERYANSLGVKHPYLTEEWHSVLNGHHSPYDYTCGSKFKAWWICRDCKSDYISPIVNRVSGKGCPYCATGKGERLTGTYLADLFPLVQITHQFKIPLKITESFSSSGWIKVDYQFMLDGIEHIVEYNGTQHYEPVRWSTSASQKDAEMMLLNYQQPRDEWIRRYCKANGVRLVVIDGRKFRGVRIRTKLEELFSTT